jgi:hypothetical protein
MLSQTACSGRPVDEGVWEERDIRLVGRNEEKCFVSSNGPIVFMAKVRVSCSWSSWEGDFSG